MLHGFAFRFGDLLLLPSTSTPPPGAVPLAPVFAKGRLHKAQFTSDDVERLLAFTGRECWGSQKPGDPTPWTGSDSQQAMDWVDAQLDFESLRAYELRSSSAWSPAPAPGVTPPSPPPPTPPVPIKVTVSIQLSAPVACPGHPLALTAKGEPTGGTYAWTVGNGAELVDASGHPASSGDTVYLRGFQPDDTRGSLPAQNPSVSVTYTHPSGNATDSKPVPVHKIDFVVNNDTVTTNILMCEEVADGVNVGHAGVPEIQITPTVTIKLDPTCPRKDACAANHKAGFLQTVLSNDKHLRYHHTDMSIRINTPIRDDGTTSAGPFYHDPYTRTFTGDNDTQRILHEDSPRWGARWIDPRPGAPAPPPPVNGQLRRIVFKNAFHTWLVVQNLEWANHDVAKSFVFLRNFPWSIDFNATSDYTKLVGGRITPWSTPVQAGAVETGRGSVNPILTAPSPNANHTIAMDPSPPL